MATRGIETPIPIFAPEDRPPELAWLVGAPFPAGVVEVAVTLADDELAPVCVAVCEGLYQLLR